MKKILTILVIILIVVCVGAFAFWATHENNKNNTENANNLAENQIAKFPEGQTVNPPSLAKGMQAITFEEGKENPIVLSEEERKEGIWYDYIAQEKTTEAGGTSKWANAMTLDGSMWVWIPRYAYKIEWNQEEKVGKIDVMFLVGTTNYNAQGQDVTTLGYTIHPAFQDGTKNNYANGEWDKAISGIWISKFEAGFSGQKNTASENVKIVNTNIKYERNAENVIGKIISNETYMTYPVFMGKAYSYNNVEVGEMYNLSQTLTQSGNPYGLDETVDSHLTKNSEWGAVSYLAHSQYGRNGTQVSINNITVPETVYAVETITGYTGNTVHAAANTINETNKPLKDSYNGKSYAWYTKEGKLGSTTGNLYGVYDMNGGASEYTAGYIASIKQDLGELFAKSMMQNKSSTKYYTVYNAVSNEEETAYEANKMIYGDAIIETSKNGKGYTSWFGETSIYIQENAGFFLRSGGYDRATYSGLFDFTNHSGHSSKNYGFHSILINK